MLIKFTKRVVFSDMEGAVLKVFEVGDTVEVGGGGKTGHYFIYSMGGIYFDEAEEVI